MAGVQIYPPFQVFTDTTGEPLENGYIYIGQVNQNAEVYPIPVFWDLDLTIPAAQPIRTLGGYPDRAGTPSKLYTSSVTYSITIKDRNQEFVYSALNSSTTTELQALLANDSDVSAGAALIGRGGQVANSIAELRTLLKTVPSKAAFVTGYYAAGDGGGGAYYLDELDTTSADNGGTIIVAADGGRWKLVKTTSIDVRQFGAKADDSTDATVPINATITWAIDNEIGEVHAIGKYMITAPLVFDTGAFVQGISLVGDGCNTSRIRQTGAGQDAIWWSTTQFLRSSQIRNIEILCDATAGHGVNIKFGCVACRFDNVNVTALNPVKSLYVGNWAAFSVFDPHGVFDTEWQTGDLYVTPAHTVNAIDFVTNGTTFNENRFVSLRCNQGDNEKFFRITNNDVSTWLVNNRFENLNFEICKAGGILATNTRGWVIENVSFWDAGTYTDHLIHFASNAGLEGIANTLINVQRNGDTLAVGVKDIWTEYADFTDVINCFNYAGLVPAFDWGNNNVTVMGPALLNESNAGLRIYVNQDTYPGAFAVINGVAGTLQITSNLSLTKLGVGQYRLTFALVKASTTYRVDAMMSSGTPGVAVYAKNTAFVDIFTFNLAGAAFDPTTIDVTIKG